MGDLLVYSSEPYGAVLEEGPLSSSSSSSSPLVSSNQAATTAEYWRRAEEATKWIIAKVQPTFVSDRRRRAVIDYVQGLIKNSIGYEVSAFGSVPLKTYLPDGDIDLTAFGGLNVDEALATDVCSVLEREEQNRAAEFVVKDVQLIRAEVKLVKCLVQNIVVDISFNQLGGLSTLCFLEKVDRQIGKDHLFKRSIILIKAWCYYESRILGAHHGLISTYALETMVLYIFHVFHSTLNGPLAVLYKFLDYFSKFDWDNYGISLNGPVRISLFPEVVAETPENGGCDLLLSKDFLKDCVENFAVPARGFEKNSRTFLPKHLNIVDPLKENNNLGRSVSKGNFYRIKSAFTYGARKLARILSQPEEENVADELSKFFSNTMDRHGSGHRPDVQDPVPIDGQYGFGATLPFSGRESCEDHSIHEAESTDSSGTSREFRLDHEHSFHDGVGVKALGRELSFSGNIEEPHNSVRGTYVSENRTSGDAKDLATSRIQCLSISNDAFISSAPNARDNISPVGKALHAPHLYFSCSAMGNGETRNGNPEWKVLESVGFMEKGRSSGILPAPSEEAACVVCSDRDDNQVISNHELWSPVRSVNHPLLFSSVAWSSEELHRGHSSNWTLANTSGILEVFNSLSDLTGDYESHLRSFRHVRWWYEYASNASIPSTSPPLLHRLQNKNSWDVSMQSRQNMISHMNANGFVPRTVLYTGNPLLLPGAAFGMEEMPKARGTGTYFPNVNHYRDRPLTPRGRNQVPVRSPRNNGRILTPQDTNLAERNNSEPSQSPFHIHQGGGKAGSSDFFHSGSLESKPCSNLNGPHHVSEKVVEFGSFGHQPFGVVTAQGGRQPNPGFAAPQNSSVNDLVPGIQMPVSAMDQDRIAVQSYQLKDEDDFPPLSDASGKGMPNCLVRKPEEENSKC